VGTDNGVFLSTDSGASWIAANTGLTNKVVYSLVVIDANIFAGTRKGVFLSTNNGTNWTAVNNELQFVIALAGNGKNLFAGTSFNGLYFSHDNGNNWDSVYTGLKETAILSLAMTGTNVFAGTYGGVFLSSDSGSHWVPVNLTDPYKPAINSFIVRGTNIFASAYNQGIFFSTDNGTHWANIGLTPRSVLSIATSGSNIFAGIYADSFSFSDGIFLSTNNGVHWTGVGLVNNEIKTLAICGAYLFAGAYSAGVWRRPLSEMISTDVEIENNLPAMFSLDQNFPNPFNPTTTISFALSSRSFVSLKIYDLVGREVARLVSNDLPAGYYTRTWNAGQYSSGVYFYSFRAGSFTETKKLILLR
jgi:hypothetical protein